MTENQLKYLAHQETMRHNAATESDATRKTDETIRSNLADEALTSQDLREKQKHNLATEGETERHNKATEAIDRTVAATKSAGEIVKSAKTLQDMFAISNLFW